MAGAVGLLLLGGGRAAHAQAAMAAPARPLTLARLLESVRARHPLVEAAQARVRAAAGSRRSAGALGNPVVGYEVEGAARSGTATMMEREVMTTAMLPLEPIYQRGARIRRAAAEVRVAEAEARATGQDVALDAARRFFETALAQIRLDAQRELYTWLDSVVTYNRARVKEGVAAEADLLRSQLERDRAGAEATRFEAELIRSRALLASFVAPDAALPTSIGASEEDDALVVDVRGTPLPLPSVGIPVSAGLPASTALTGAFNGRPQVAAARERVAAASAGLATERTMLLRQLSATIGTKQTQGARGLIAGVSLPFPLFDQNRGEVARAQGEREAVAFELVAAERSARAEIIGALGAARLLSERATQLSAPGPNGQPAYLARADEARRIALGAYREGAVPLLTVIDAARAWGEARLAYYETIYAQHESVLALLAAQGLDLRLATGPAPVVVPSHQER
jgi:cobalt-zinc-cadmium efflux system outer membrane protein